MDYSIRIPATKARISWIEENCKTKKELPKIVDYLYRPKNIALINFDPNDIVIRLREFVEEKKPAILIMMQFIKSNSGYTDKKTVIAEGMSKDLINKAKKLDYIKWGVLKTHSVEYDLGKGVKALYQQITLLGEFIKIESEKESELGKLLKKMNVTKKEAIEKNAAVLLFEKITNK